jgi:hypothetical protein
MKNGNTAVRIMVKEGREAIGVEHILLKLNGYKAITAAKLKTAPTIICFELLQFIL